MGWYGKNVRALVRHGSPLTLLTGGPGLGRTSERVRPFVCSIPMKRKYKFSLALGGVLVGVAAVNFYPPQGWWSLAASAVGITFAVWMALIIIENVDASD